jgi:hypothetical protein
LKLVPAKWHCLVPPPAGNANRWVACQLMEFGEIDAKNIVRVYRGAG